MTSDLSEEKDWHCCAKSSHNSATMEQLHHNQKESWLYDKGLQFFQQVPNSSDSLLLHHSVEILAGDAPESLFGCSENRPVVSHLEKAVAHKSWHTYNPL